MNILSSEAKHNLFHIYVSRLNQANIKYMVTGAVASIIYGEPRLTHDIDLVVELHEDEVARLIKAFPLDNFYCPPPEVIKVEARRPLHGHFNLIHHETGFKADIYTLGKDELHQWAMANRKRLDVEGEALWLAPMEYVILRKLMYYREGRSEKHLKDIAGMMEASFDQIDSDQLHEKIRYYRLEKEWEEIQSILK